MIHLLGSCLAHYDKITSLQGNLCVHDIFGGNDSVQLKGLEIAAELKYLLSLLTLCWHFSKKPFVLFLKETGYTDEDVLIQEPKAGVTSHAYFLFSNFDI